ncbi:hypothetical protein LshimejAT787_0201890 [Lyophyllum shimeji]|uniref:Uncharacterized protein n=1 Tax=Lyophyllum shimeji TaxID=47721 RepID=A0A9P3PFL5_LYOSH|nr:hypothetical protein LshimejAT787_0201890 [Lyophyllum shimeji]
MSVDSESYSDDRSLSLSLEIPHSSFVDSSLAPSPTGILSPSGSTSQTASTSSLASKAGVTFAPLPELAPRKRRSTAPLGMAARTALVRRRRGGDFPAAMAYQGGNPMWTDEEIEQQRQHAMAEGRRRHHQHHYVDEDEDEMEDPFLALGRLMKGAGKSIWRKVSHTHKDAGKRKEKDKYEKERVADGDGKKAGDENGSWVEVQAEAEAASPGSGAEERQVLATILQNGESAMDTRKDDDEEHFRTVGQTETLREDTKCTWITQAVDDVDADGGTPTRPEHHLRDETYGWK